MKNATSSSLHGGWRSILALDTFKAILSFHLHDAFINAPQIEPIISKSPTIQTYYNPTYGMKFVWLAPLTLLQVSWLKLIRVTVRLRLMIYCHRSITDIVRSLKNEWLHNSLRIGNRTMLSISKKAKRHPEARSTHSLRTNSELCESTLPR